MREMLRVLGRVGAIRAMERFGVIEAMEANGLVGNIRMKTELTARHIRDGKEIDRRVVKNKLITTAFVDFIVDQLIAETSAFGDFKFHDSGTGVGGEAIGDTTLGTPWGGARSVGTQVEDAHNIYESVATTTYTGPFAITEHGLFNIAAAGILMDRSVFAAVNVVNTDKVEFTYRLTIAAGG